MLTLVTNMERCRIGENLITQTEFGNWLIDGWMHGWMGGWMDGSMDGSIDGSIDWLMDRLIDSFNVVSDNPQTMLASLGKVNLNQFTMALKEQLSHYDVSNYLTDTRRDNNITITSKRRRDVILK